MSNKVPRRDCSKDALVECLKPWLNMNHQLELKQYFEAAQASESYALAMHQQIDTVWDAHMSEHRLRVACEERLAQQDQTILELRQELREANRIIRGLARRIPNVEGTEF